MSWQRFAFNEVNEWVYLRNIYAQIKKCLHQFQQSIIKELQQLKHDEEETEVMSYVDKFLQEKKSRENEYFSDKQLIVTLLDFFTGGSGTVSKTLAFCLLYLLHHPDSQERIRQEAIDIEQGPYHLLLWWQSSVKI